MARFYLIFLIVVIFGLSFFANPERGELPEILNLSLLPLGVLTYMNGAISGVAGTLVCLALLLAHLFVGHIDPHSIAPNVLVFLLTPAVFGLLRKVNTELKSLLAGDVEIAIKALDSIRARDARLDMELKESDEKVSEIVTLYEVTKEMSGTLLFGEIFHIFSSFLKNNFSFLICKLILVNQGALNGADLIEKVYRIDNVPLGASDMDDAGPEISPSVVGPELVDVDMLTEISKTGKIIFWEDFISVPLIAQNRIIGVLNVEGLDATTLEKFLIVAKQFSLEIEKVRLYETTQELAITDGLTGVFMRRYFLEMFREELERSVRNEMKLSFLMVDIDHFKACNDKYGHLVGDAVLKEVASILKDNVREIDFVGRYGGEEFSLLLPETDRQGAIFVAERLRGSVERHDFRAYDELLRFTISIGVASFPEDASRGADLIEIADQALYDAKQKGRNRVSAK